MLLGHSLGAQIAGTIGRALNSLGIKIPRITGLDPAGPCFYTYYLKGLSRDDAKFVDIIHTDPGKVFPLLSVNIYKNSNFINNIYNNQLTNPATFGSRQPYGHADFYPNGDLLEDMAPACDVGFFKKLVKLDHVCSHTLAWVYYAESVVPGHDADFLSRLCSGSKCSPELYPMGYAANPSNPIGKYHLKTKQQCPYGGNDTALFSLEFCNIIKPYKIH